MNDRNFTINDIKVGVGRRTLRQRVVGTLQRWHWLAKREFVRRTMELAVSLCTCPPSAKDERRSGRRVIIDDCPLHTARSATITKTRS